MSLRLLLWLGCNQRGATKVQVHVDLQIADAPRRTNTQCFLDITPTSILSNNSSEHIGFLDSGDGLPY